MPFTPLAIIPAMSDKKNTKITRQEGLALFQEAVKGVKPLRQDKAPPFRKSRRPEPLPPAQKSADKPNPQFLADMDIETTEALLFVQPGIQKRVVKNLQKGRIPPADSLDLHGLRVKQAQPIFTRFLKQAHHRELRCILIIHGKGREPAA